jgi:aryl-alcohol dehydrogenase-like predicted oxidoreductase
MTNQMPTRKLRDLEVSAIGLGCMPMSWGYNVADADRNEIRATLHRALELGITLFDTADVYGPWTNEEILGEYLVKDGLRDKAIIASKCGLTPVNMTSYGKIHCADSALITWIFINCIVLIRKSRLKKLGALLPDLLKRARFATSDYLKQQLKKLQSATPFILLLAFRASFQFGQMRM